MFKQMLTTIIVLLPMSVYGVQSINLSTRIITGEWNSDAGVIGGDVSQQGGQLGFSLAYHRDKFFTGIRLQGGDYRFTDNAPNQITAVGAQAVANSTVKHGEFDLLAGYYFFERTAFFLDIKTTSDKWLSNNYQQDFSGLGVGVNSFYPINKNWLLYGSFGVTANAQLNDINKNKLADASSVAFDIGFSYKLGERSALGIGLNLRAYTYTLPSGTAQTYSIGGLSAYYQHRFEMP